MLRDVRRIELRRVGILGDLLQLGPLPAADAQDSEKLQGGPGLFLFQLRAQPGVEVGLFGKLTHHMAGVGRREGEYFHAHDGLGGVRCHGVRSRRYCIPGGETAVSGLLCVGRETEDGEKENGEWFHGRVFG